MELGRKGQPVAQPANVAGDRQLMRRFSDAGTHDANHALRRPASEKRQGTKSRWGIVGGAATMGISSRAQASMWWNVAARWAILPRGILPDSCGARTCDFAEAGSLECVRSGNRAGGSPLWQQIPNVWPEITSPKRRSRDQQGKAGGQRSGQTM